MPNFTLLLYRLPASARPSSPDEFAARMKTYMAWTDRIRAEGRYKGGQKLMDDAGKILTPAGGRVSITDGPYAESKELLGGFYIISAKDYDDACQVAETSPHLSYGGRIEVRQIHEL
ncbi:MAG TPA: YciI family protein [Stellaceae bacterium]|nr:YciI family protein [Stellaceae bacterium]